MQLNLKTEHLGVVAHEWIFWLGVQLLVEDLPLLLLVGVTPSTTAGKIVGFVFPAHAENNDQI